MLTSIIVCLASLAILIWWLRRKGESLGIPIAYLFALLFIHVPGAIAHLVGGDYLPEPEATEIGIRYTSIGAIAFVVGVMGVGAISDSRRRKGPMQVPGTERHRFAVFCLVAGLLVTYTLRLVINIPSIGAVIEKGGGIWVLGVLLGLQSAVRRGDGRQIAFWIAAMAVYPVLTLILGGFLSFGSTPVIIILSALAISTRSSWRVGIGLTVVSLIFFTMFLSYFQSRDQIRDAVWGGADLKDRISESAVIVTGMELFDHENPEHLDALDRRLNQNFFVGRADQRIRSGTVDFLYGRSFWEGAISLVPRIIWPSKPVYGGSPETVMAMTGFVVNEWTSYGIGNVMEFHINFGMPSLIIGFLLLGLLLGWLDRNASRRIMGGEWGRALLYFAPAAAMIHPNGSLVELVSGGAAAYVAALGWKMVWEHFNPPKRDVALISRRRHDRRPGHAVVHHSLARLKTGQTETVNEVANAGAISLSGDDGKCGEMRTRFDRSTSESGSASLVNEPATERRSQTVI